MARLRNFERKIILRGFRAVLFRMVTKPFWINATFYPGFRAVLFRMVTKPPTTVETAPAGFRAVLFRMVTKLHP